MGEVATTTVKDGSETGRECGVDEMDKVPESSSRMCSLSCDGNEGVVVGAMSEFFGSKRSVISDCSGGETLMEFQEF